MALKQSGPGSCGCSCWGTDCIPPIGVSIPGSPPSGSGSNDCCNVPYGTYMIGGGDDYWSDLTDYSVADCIRCKWTWGAIRNKYSMRQLTVGFPPTISLVVCRNTFTPVTNTANDVFAECLVFPAYSTSYGVYGATAYGLFGMKTFSSPASLQDYATVVTLELLVAPLQVRVKVRRNYTAAGLYIPSIATDCTSGAYKWAEGGFGSVNEIPGPLIWAKAYTIDTYLLDVSDCAAVASSIAWTSRESWWQKYEQGATSVTTTTGSTDSFTVTQRAGFSDESSATFTMCSAISSVGLVF